MNKRTIAAAFFGALTAMPSFASAQSPTQSKSSGVATEVEITEKARRHFRAGVAFVEDPDGARYADAYREFQIAYEESPSWKILGNLGLAAMKLERDGEAIEALKTYLAEGGDEVDLSERAQFERDIEMLEASVTWVTVTASLPGGSLEDRRTPLAGAPRINVYDMKEESLKVGVHAGRHRLSLSLDGYEPMSWTFDAAGGELSHHFELVPLHEHKEPAIPDAPPAEPVDNVVVTRPVPTSVWIGAGITGALVVGAAVTGVMATGKQSEFEKTNDGTDVSAAEDLKKSGETLNLVTDIMLGGAVVGAVVTTVLYVTRPEVRKTESLVSWSPAAFAGGGGLWVNGKF
jgi:hypothetical protein